MKSLAIFFLFAAFSCINGYVDKKDDKTYPYDHYLGNEKYVRYEHAYPYSSMANCAVYTKDFKYRSCSLEFEGHLCTQDCHYDKHCQKPENTEPKICCWVNCRNVCRTVKYVEELRKENQREKRLGLHWDYLGLPNPYGAIDDDKKFH